jgi:hypothetical protein
MVGNSLHASWTPTMSLHLQADATFQRISDGNQRWDLTLAPRYAIVRRAHLNLDLGASAYRLQTAWNLANGYYDPSRYESYAVVAYPYWKISDNVGLGASLALGGQREASAPFALGGQAMAEGTVGVYRAWGLRVAAGMTNNRRLGSGAYRGISGSVVVIRRF